MFGRLKVFLLALLVLALAGAARAETIFPVGATYTYAASDGTNKWTSTITFTSSTTMEMTDWDGPDQEPVTVPISLTKDSFYIYYFINGNYVQQLLFSQQFPVNYTWNFTADDGSSGTATVVAILDSFTVQAGTFSNVYQVAYLSTEGDDIHMKETMYWKPGVGLLQANDYMYPHFHQLTSYAAPVPLPPGLVLFGTGLVSLAVWRRFRQG